MTNQSNIYFIEEISESLVGQYIRCLGTMTDIDLLNKTCTLSFNSAVVMVNLQLIDMKDARVDSLYQVFGLLENKLQVSN